MTAALTYDALKNMAEEGSVDTVLVWFGDMQGRLMGKRFHVSNFLESGYE